MGTGLQYEGTSADQGTVTYNSENNSLTWNLGTIPNGGDVLLKIFVRIIQSGTATPNLTTTSRLIHVDQYDIHIQHTTCALSAPTGADIQVNQTQNNIHRHRRKTIHNIHHNHNQQRTRHSNRSNNNRPTTNRTNIHIRHQPRNIQPHTPEPGTSEHSPTKTQNNHNNSINNRNQRNHTKHSNKNQRRPIRPKLRQRRTNMHLYQYQEHTHQPQTYPSTIIHGGIIQTPNHNSTHT